MPHVLVWDIETIPDISGFAAANNLFDKTAAEVRAAMGDKFPKHIYHSIACIGALIAHHDIDHWVVDALGAPHVGERSERDLIAAFVDKIAQLKPLCPVQAAKGIPLGWVYIPTADIECNKDRCDINDTVEAHSRPDRNSPTIAVFKGGTTSALVQDNIPRKWDFFLLHAPLYKILMTILSHAPVTLAG